MIRKIDEDILDKATLVWNEVVSEGRAFPQTDCLDLNSARAFFSEQTYSGALCDDNTGEVLGVYILHPNNVGRCGHICNASYAVRRGMRGKHLGELLVLDCIKKAREYGFGILQFNAVVSSNEPALKLYKRFGFTQLGVIPKGFLNKDGVYEDIIPHYIEL